MYSQRLREIRLKNKNTQIEIAEVVGLSQSEYGKYELGKRELKANMIVKLCQYFNVSADYLLGLTDEEKTLK